VTRALRWILLLVILAAGVCLVVGVDFGGATVLDRIRGRAGPAEPRGEPAPPCDRLTEEDRKGLDRLLESKLRDKKEGEASP
jgi:hypothetical protein